MQSLPPLGFPSRAAPGWCRIELATQTGNLSEQPSLLGLPIAMAGRQSASIHPNTKVDRLKVIPNGVDMSVFKPGDKAAARSRVGWPQDAFVVMFAASGVRNIKRKDYPAMREAIRLAGEQASNRPIRFFAIGDTAPAEQAGAVTIEFLPYRDSMVECYQAADVYLHAARADTFPTVILEAMACGTPVVATAVDGIPEQIIEGETGFLVPAGDAPALAKRLTCLAQSSDLLRVMGTSASRNAADRFSLERMVTDYVQFYQEVIEQRTETHEH